MRGLRRGVPGASRVRVLGFLAISAAAVAMLVLAYALTGYAHELLVNLGASLVIVALTYAIFDPVFQELRRSQVREQAVFDGERFSGNVAAARTVARVMDTANHMLEGRQREKFLAALAAAATRETQVQILLLDPDAPATRQRAAEIYPVDVRGVIIDNLRHLHDCRAALPPAAAEYLEVRVYDALPAIQLYQWDDAALISFYPPGQRASASPHLEIDTNSPLGQFALGRFEELWGHPSTVRLDQWWQTEISLLQDGTHVDTRPVRFVEVDGAVVLDGSQVADLLIDYGRDHVTAVGSAGSRPFRGSREHRLTRLSTASDLYASALREFKGKYGRAVEGTVASQRMMFVLEPLGEG